MPLGRRAQAQGVGAAGGFSDPKRLEAEIAAGDRRQPDGLLVGAAVAENGPHRVHLGVTGAAVAPRLLHFFEDGTAHRDTKTAAAIFLGDESGQKPGRREGAHEFARVFALGVFVAPILARKFVAQRADGFTNLIEVLAVA